MYNQVRLISHFDDIVGVEGISIAGNENNPELYACTEGKTLAHDIIEHINGPEAMGSLADELEALGAAMYVRSPWIELNIKGDLEHLSETSNAHLVPVIPFEPCEFDGFPQLLHIPIHWYYYLHRGYNKAKAKYPCSLDAYEMFCRIRDAFSQFMSRQDLIPGEYFTLHYNRDEAFIT